MFGLHHTMQLRYSARNDLDRQRNRWKSLLKHRRWLLSTRQNGSIFLVIQDLIIDQIRKNNEVLRFFFTIIKYNTMAMDDVQMNEEIWKNCTIMPCAIHHLSEKCTGIVAQARDEHRSHTLFD